MKILLITLVAFAGVFVGQVMGQGPETNNREKMKAFESWIGHWRGEGSMQQGPGEPKRSMVDEHIEFKLEGTIVLVEGTGKTTDPATKAETIVHHALGILSYDAGTSQYKFKSYLNNGRSADAWFTVTGVNKYQWGFDIPSGGKTRYSITIDPTAKTWIEIGEFSRDGNTWMKYFEMNLKKVD